MTTPSERHAWVAGTFSDRVDGVRDWSAPAPVPGWVARDVVAHLVDWMPGFLAGGGVTLVVHGPAVADDPVGAWHAHAAAMQALLDAPDADREFSYVSKAETFSEAEPITDVGARLGWTVVSMANDWETVFAG